MKVIKYKWLQLALVASILWVGLPAAFRDGGPSGMTLNLAELQKNAFFGAYVADPANPRILHSSGVYQSSGSRPSKVRLRFADDPAITKSFFVKATFNNDGEMRVSGVSFDALILHYWHLPLYRVPLDRLRQWLGANPKYATLKWEGGTAHLQTQSYANRIILKLAYTPEQWLNLIPGWRQWLAIGINLLAVMLLALLAWRVDRMLPALRNLGQTVSKLATAPTVTPNSIAGKGCWIAAGMALLLALVLLRSWPNLMHPELYVEDSTHHFNYYFGDQHPFADVFKRPNRYIAFGTYFIAWLTAKLPGATQPYIYLTVAALGAWITASAISLTGLFRRRLSLLLVPSVLGLAGLNHIVFWSTLTYQIFNAVILLLALMFLPTPASRTGKLLYALLLTLLIWSGPFSVLVVPVALLMLAFRLYPGKSSILIYITTCALLYYMTILSGTTKLTTILGDPRRYYHFASLMFEEVYFLGLAGHVTATKILAFILAMGSLFYLLRKDIRYLRTAVVLNVISLLSLSLYFLSSKYMIFAHWPNHLTISIFFWLVFLMLSLDHLFTAYAPTPILPVAAWALIGWLVVVDNQHHPKIWHKELYPEIPAYLDTVKHYEWLTPILRAKNEKLVVFSPAHWLLGGPVATIGSQAPDARKIGSADLGDNFGREFIDQPETVRETENP